jgi:hypothetical protein
MPVPCRTDRVFGLETPSPVKTRRLLTGSLMQTRNVWNDPILTKQDKI